MTVETMAQHEALMQSLMDPTCWPQGGGDRRRIDTHISTVILAGDVAYKLKKPLDLGFLDFLSLDARHRACREELRVNGRFAPQLYQAVCAVTGRIEHPEIDGDGEIIDWAVCMRRFDPDAILSKKMDRLNAELIETLAAHVATFHAGTDVCDPAEPYGNADMVYVPMLQNIEHIRKRAPQLSAEIEPLAQWTAAQHEQLKDVLRQRKTQGHIRECHGDLHLGNVALIGDAPVMFDAIEFNPGLRWIDTISDVAFMTMDLHERGRADLAQRFLDGYLQHSGDHAGLAVLRFYEVYRAMVRAKIAAIRSTQADLDDNARRAVDTELRGYVDFAKRFIRPRRGAVVITHGVSGSGKSHVTKDLADVLPVIRLRSDVERKRLLGIEPTKDATERGAYSQALTEQTYARLEDLSKRVVEAGHIVIVDATFLKHVQRNRFRTLAERLQVPFIIIDCDAPVEVLRQRILERKRQAGNVSDADLTVLDGQLAMKESLTEEEKAWRIAIPPDGGLDARLLQQQALPGSDS